MPVSSAYSSSYGTMRTSTTSSYTAERMGGRFERVPSFGRADVRYREPSVTSSTRLPRKDSFTMSLSRSSVARESPVLRRRDLSESNGSLASHRHSVLGGIGSETAKYKREEAMKEIQASFEKDYSDNRKKYGLDSVGIGAYRAQRENSYVDEREAKKNLLSDMFMETNKFSSRTMAALTSLEKDNKQKKEYNWRKQMEEFEMSKDLDRDHKSRSIEGRRKRKEDSDTSSVASGIRRFGGGEGKPPAVPAKAPKTESSASVRKELKPVVMSRPAEVPKDVSSPALSKVEERKTRTAQVPQPTVAKAKDTPTESKRGKVAEADAAAAAAQDAVAAASEQVAKKQKQSNDAESTAAAVSEQKPAEGDPAVIPVPAADQDAEEDPNGTKALKSEFSARMASLDLEMEAGRSKLAKLRERIRKAKGAVAAADEALAKCKT